VRLVSISVENFRSITKAPKIRIGRSTTFVGPNNEGKSNILLALAIAMKVVTDERVVRVDRRILRHDLVSRWYEWERDYPVHLQSKHPEGNSIITLEFQLDQLETVAFKQATKSNLNGTLPIKVSLGKRDSKVEVAKQGKGKTTLSQKSIEIARFVATRLDFEYIPAVRTAESSEEIVRGLVERELRTLEDEPEFQKALSRISKLQEPILAQLSGSIKETLVKFLPDVRDVAVSIRSAERFRALRTNCEIIVDDGRRTSLQFKGDGVQSLAALGIMRHASERSAKGKSLVIAVEEPESHLHPTAIHDLYGVLKELSQKHQVVITTHCPLFVDRVQVSNNVIVHKQKARPAMRIDEVREILGVRASDNLRHAEIVLLVEGQDDKIALSGILPTVSSSIANALTSGTLAIDFIGGSGNLSYKAGLVKEALCSVHVLLDHDQAGKTSFQTAKDGGVLSLAEANFVTVPGLSESEFEDMVDPSVYKTMLWTRFKVNIDSPKFKSSKKWSERLKATFLDQGKLWNDETVMEVKLSVARLCAAHGSPLHPARSGAFDGLVKSLESRLEELRTAAEE
jgi:predicted ATP-dependent endonuclease of OLD family